MAEIAQAMLDGRVSFIVGTRQILALRGRAGYSDLEQDLLPLIAVDSESDRFPIGDVRALWSTAGLARLQPEMDRVEQWARDVASEACRDLIRRINAASRPDEP